MLILKNLVVRYGGVQALKGISMEARKGAVTTLIGANGAGKSTTLRAISGLVPITSGEILFEGGRIDGLAPETITKLGIVQVPEGKRLFPEMSVLDNLLTGAYLRKDVGRLAADLEDIYTYFPVLRKTSHRPASNLSGGEQQMLAIGRALMARPKLLLLDEPSLGLSPILTEEVGSIIEKIANEGVSILLIEQNASLALKLAQKAYVMETGRITLEGSPEELQKNAHVKEAYLGLSPTEEATIAAIKPQRLKASSTPTSMSQGRWQDKSSQTRWQDRVDQKRLIFSVKSREEPVQGGQTKEKGVLEGKAQETWKVKELGLENEISERWPEDRNTQERGVIKKGLQDGLQLGKRFEDSEALERWPEEMRIRDRKLSLRVVKKTFIPVVRGSA
jgi:branched-chain amino acid transport system ATP-binding protein